jgi:hypothetical protein
VRRAQNISLEPGEELHWTFDPGVHQERVLMRISENSLPEPVSAFLLLADNFKPERRFVQTLDFGNKIAALIVKKVSPSVNRNWKSRICGVSIVG